MMHDSWEQGKASLSLSAPSTLSAEVRTEPRAWHTVDKLCATETPSQPWEATSEEKFAG